jgi:hypothetical protein
MVKELKLGDLVKPTKETWHTSYHAKGLGLIVDIGEHSTYKDSLSSRDKWLEYTILWSETGNKTKHFIGQLTKISGEEIWNK